MRRLSLLFPPCTVTRKEEVDVSQVTVHDKLLVSPDPVQKIFASRYRVVKTTTTISLL